LAVVERAPDFRVVGSDAPHANCMPLCFPDFWIGCSIVAQTADQREQGAVGCAAYCIPLMPPTMRAVVVLCAPSGCAQHALGV